MLPAFGAGRLSKSIRPADDFLDDLVDTAVDALRAGVKKGSTDRTIAHVAIAAMELLAVICRYIGCASARSKGKP
jgi:hypothetical protein